MSIACCSTVPSMLEKDVIRVPTSSLRLPSSASRKSFDMSSASRDRARPMSQMM